MPLPNISAFEVTENGFDPKSVKLAEKLPKAAQGSNRHVKIPLYEIIGSKIRNSFLWQRRAIHPIEFEDLSTGVCQTYPGI
jgi:hypothetical protein